MATCTFNKNIVLSPDAAQRLADELNDSKPAVRPDKSKIIPTASEKETHEWLRKIINSKN